jgi:hypothetical protein
VSDVTRMSEIYNPADFSFADVDIDTLQLEMKNNIIQIQGNFGGIVDEEMVEYESYLM